MMLTLIPACLLGGLLLCREMGEFNPLGCTLPSSSPLKNLSFEVVRFGCSYGVPLTVTCVSDNFPEMLLK